MNYERCGHGVVTTGWGLFAVGNSPTARTGGLWPDRTYFNPDEAPRVLEDPPIASEDPALLEEWRQRQLAAGFAEQDVGGRGPSVDGKLAAAKEGATATDAWTLLWSRPGQYEWSWKRDYFMMPITSPGGADEMFVSSPNALTSLIGL